MTEADAENEALRAAAELLGLLLLHELDAPTLARLRDPRLADLLAEAGVELPSPAEEAAWIEERAADYHDLFLGPAGVPIVHSLFTEGRYEGEPAVRVRALAQAAALELNRDATRGAPHDHLGALLLLWSAASERMTDAARAVASDHLEWAGGPLARVVEGGGFYGAVARLTLDLIGAIRAQVAASAD